MPITVPPTSAPWLFISFRKRCMLREFARLAHFRIQDKALTRRASRVQKRQGRKCFGPLENLESACRIHRLTERIY